MKVFPLALSTAIKRNAYIGTPFLVDLSAP